MWGSKLPWLATGICLIREDIATGFEFFHPFPLPQEVLFGMDGCSQTGHGAVDGGFEMWCGESALG